MSDRLAPNQGGGRVQPRHVIAATALRCGCAPAMLTGRTRRARAVRARWVAMALMHGRLGMSSVAIGQALGGRDHSTVLHGLDRVAGLAEASLTLERAWSHAVVLALREAGAALCAAREVAREVALEAALRLEAAS